MNKFNKFARNNKKFIFFLILAILTVLGAILAPYIATHDPYEAVLHKALLSPSKEHLFGTDALGRDLFSRVVYASRVSISNALILVLIIFLIGTILGIISGYFGGIIDTVIMRFADIMISFPDLILAMAIVGVLGPSMINSMIAITAAGWTKYARLSRSLVLKIKNKDYIHAARVSGTKNIHILGKHVLPNIVSTLVITATTDIGVMILTLASLSFLGLGVQPPTPEWGYMLNEGRIHLQTAPWLMIYPGLAIFIIVVIFNLLGDSLRDVLDPRD